MSLFRKIRSKHLLHMLEKDFPTASKCHHENAEWIDNALSTIYAQDGLSSESKAQRKWNDNERRLIRLLQTRDIRLFLRWDVIQNTMIVTGANIVEPELEGLKHMPGWRRRWQNAIRESVVGMPIPYKNCPIASGNSIHHTYHIARFEEFSGCCVDEMDLIFEFGGGYGSMCRIIHQMGFKGNYIIFDLPVFSVLQKYYLSANLLPVIDDTLNNTNNQTAIRCISSAADLTKALSVVTRKTKAMFLSTWAISETSMKAREEILPTIQNFPNFLIAYQNQFGEVDNEQYFKSITGRNSLAHLEWKFQTIPHIQESCYLFGSTPAI